MSFPSLLQLLCFGIFWEACFTDNAPKSCLWTQWGSWGRQVSQRFAILLSRFTHAACIGKSQSWLLLGSWILQNILVVKHGSSNKKKSQFDQLMLLVMFTDSEFWLWFCCFAALLMLVAFEFQKSMPAFFHILLEWMTLYLSNCLLSSPLIKGLQPSLLLLAVNLPMIYSTNDVALWLCWSFLNLLGRGQVFFFCGACVVLWLVVVWQNYFSCFVLCWAELLKLGLVSLNNEKADVVLKGKLSHQISRCSVSCGDGRHERWLAVFWERVRERIRWTNCMPGCGESRQSQIQADHVAKRNACKQSLHCSEYGI